MEKEIKTREKDVPKKDIRNLKKIVPLLNLAISVEGALSSILGFVGVIAILVSGATGSAIAFIAVLMMYPLMAGTGETLITMIIGFIFFKNKICKISAFISLGGFLLGVIGLFIVL